MIEVDRAMINDYQISLIQMMENAGRTLTILTRERFLQGNARARSIIVWLALAETAEAHWLQRDDSITGALTSAFTWRIPNISTACER